MSGTGQTAQKAGRKAGSWARSLISGPEAVTWLLATESAAAVAGVLAVGLAVGLGPGAIVAAVGAMFSAFVDSATPLGTRLTRMAAASVVIAGTSAVAVAVSATPVLFALVLAVLAAGLGFWTGRSAMAPRILTSSLMGSIVFAHLAALEPGWKISVLLLAGGAALDAAVGVVELLRQRAGAPAPSPSSPSPSPYARSTRPRGRAVAYAVLLAALVGALGLLADSSRITDAWWVPMGFLAVLRPQFQVTWRRAGLQMLGALAAVTPVGLLIEAIRPAPAVLVPVILLCVLGTRRYMATHYAVGSFWLTLFILSSLEIAGQLKPDTALLRVAAVVIGGLIAVSVAAIWHRLGSGPARATRAPRPT